MLNWGIIRSATTTHNSEKVSYSGIGTPADLDEKMEQSEIIEVRVRSLAGESTMVSISPNKTIGELKLLLNQTFFPASTSPNYHLFLKGMKLNLESQISNHHMASWEFLVLVPFAKKNKQPDRCTSEIVIPSEVSNHGVASKMADSAWSEMMEDLKSLRGISSGESATNIDLEPMNSPERNKVNGKLKRKRGSSGGKKDGPLHDFIISILQSTVSSVLDERNCERFVCVLELSSCLTNPHSGNCMMREANLQDTEMNLGMNSSSYCLCPSWLKAIMKAFTFLNIYSSFLHVHREKVTVISLTGVLLQLGYFGCQVSILDLEYLSVLCPQVVHFVDKETKDIRSYDALVIIKSSTEQENYVASNPSAASRPLPLSTIFNAIDNRKSSFETNLLGVIQLLMCKNGNKMREICLEDLLTFAKEGRKAASRNDRRKAKKSCSVTSTSHISGTRCHDTNPLLPLEMIEHLRMGMGSWGQMVHVEEIAARNASYVEFPCELSENTKSALRCLGITRLYSHQAQSIQASLSGKNVVVATMTSSGKSLCYNLPVIEVLSQNLFLCALYMFPTKALAQDQLRSLLTMMKGFDVSFNIGIYDGDTSQEDRIWLRDNARLLITNPDMLHMSILPFHQQFGRFLSNLRFIIIDEAHVYKGAFGCHTALILRRFRRLCSHVYGSDPSFVFSTATSANPHEHAMELANLPTMELIQNDGSPSGPKHFLLWNPPLRLRNFSKRTGGTKDVHMSVDKDIIVGRSSPIMEVSCLFAEMVQHGLRCIAFCKSRKLCELVLSYTREILREAAPDLVDSISAYRAGYIAQDRRRIERNFFGGNLRGVAATNALELGIDVGHVDVTLHLGFPGSVASLWQQAGRSGRREKPSIAIYVAFEGPLDQYFMNFPHRLFKSRIECCHIDAQNEQVLEQHLVCAAYEHPLSLLYDNKYFGPALKNSIMKLANKGYLSHNLTSHPSARMWSYIGHVKMPSHFISIRAIEAERYKVIDKQKNEVLEEIEESRAFFQVYEGAVYMNQGKTYLVKELDLSTKIALCQEADLKYYTKTRDYTDIHVIGGNIAYPVKVCTTKFPSTVAQANTCRVTTTWFGFRRIWRGSNRVFDAVELSLPDYSYESQAVWIRVPDSVKTAVEIKAYSFRGGLHAACHALLNVVPLYIICNSSDVASECVNPFDSRYVPERILLYDPCPGGTGISAQIQPIFPKLLTAALELLTSCCCSGDAGCPNCVQNLSCGEYNEVLHKDAAIIILKGVLETERSYFEETPGTYTPT